MKTFSRIVMSFALALTLACGEDEHEGLSTSPSVTAKVDAGAEKPKEGPTTSPSAVGDASTEAAPAAISCGFGTSPSGQCK